MIPVTYIFPQPRRVEVAGRTLIVQEVRIRDLIYLQNWIDAQYVDPMEEIRADLPGMDERGKRSALMEAWGKASDEHPMWNRESGAKYQRTDAAIYEMLWVILRYHHPEMCVRDEDGECPHIVALAHGMTPEEYEAIRGAWQRQFPVDEIEARLGVDSKGGQEIGWPQAVVEVIEKTGWRLDDIEWLTYSQFVMIRTGGKVKEAGFSVPPGRNAVKSALMAMRAKVKRAMRG